MARAGDRATEIKLRAIVRIGEISKTLEKAELAGRGAVSLPIGGKTKSAVLKAAGISTSAAHRAEKLATAARVARYGRRTCSGSGAALRRAGAILAARKCR